MDFDDMTSDQIRDFIAAAEKTLHERGALDAAAAAVADAIDAYAAAAGLTTLQAWRALAPEGVEVPPDPEPEPELDADLWVQPQAHNPYALGARVKFRDVIYESVISNNVWSPAAYPQGWKAIS